jgi:DNA primase
MKKFTMLCVFHDEKTPSLRVWPSGFFKCHGCGESGKAEDHPKILAAFDRVRMAELERAGQMKLF